MTLLLSPICAAAQPVESCSRITTEMNADWSRNRDVSARLDQIDRELVGREVEVQRAVVLLEQRATALEGLGKSFKEIARAMSSLSKLNCPQTRTDRGGVQGALRDVDRADATFRASAKSSRDSARNLKDAIAKGFKGTVTVHVH